MRIIPRLSCRDGLLIAGIGAALMVQGCKRAPTPPARPVVLSVPKAPQPDIPAPLPMQGEYQNPVLKPSRRRPAPAAEVQNPGADAQAIAAAQRRQDARLLQQQRAASNQQQTELNEEVKQVNQRRQQIQDEPRIQDAPEPPASSGLGPDAPRIQDAPGPDQGQYGQEAPRIQDAPGPAQTQPPASQAPPQN